MSYVKKFNVVVVDYELKQHLRFSHKVHVNVNSYVTSKEESNQTVAIFHELFYHKYHLDGYLAWPNLICAQDCSKLLSLEI